MFNDVLLPSSSNSKPKEGKAPSELYRKSYAITLYFIKHRDGFHFTFHHTDKEEGNKQTALTSTHMQAMPELHERLVTVDN
jgi:hypothetical protein